MRVCYFIAHSARCTRTFPPGINHENCNNWTLENFTLHGMLLIFYHSHTNTCTRYNIGSMILDPRIDMIFLPPSCIYLPHSCPLSGCTCYQSSTGRLSHSLLHHSRCCHSPRNSQSVPAHSEKPADQSSSVWMQLKRQ